MFRSSSPESPAAAAAGPEATLPAPVARRLSRPRWRDPRLAVGLVLVLGSVVAGGRAIAAAEDTEPVYATTQALTPGDEIGAEQVRVVRVRIPEGTAPYLQADRTIPTGAVALQGLGAGELIPLAAVGQTSAVPVQPVGIAIAQRLPSAVRKGSHVDIWAAEPDPDRSMHYLPPQRLVAGVQVAEIQESATSLGVSNAQTVQVLLDAQGVPTVLAALANDAVISVLPAMPATPGASTSPDPAAPRDAAAEENAADLDSGYPPELGDGTREERTPPAGAAGQP